MEHRNGFLASIGFAALTLAACDEAGGAGPDMIIHGGPILTMEGDAPAYAEAVAIKDGKIVQVGRKAEVMKAKGSKTTVKDLGGKLLMPSFIDSLTIANRIHVSAPPVGPASNPDEVVTVLQAGAKAKG
jgi:N-acyl-D-aspartate/D-glutamate deacylase